MGSCAFLDYYRNEAGKYSEDIDRLSGEKTTLEILAKDLVEKLRNKDLKPKEVMILSAKLALTTQKILTISNNIADKKEEERKQGVPWWYSLLNFGISALGGGGLGTLLVRLLPGRFFKFKDLE